MLVLNAFKKSFKLFSFFVLLIIFSFISFFPSFLISFNLSGEKADALDFYLSFLKNKNFFGESFSLVEFFNLSNLKLNDFFNSQLGFLFFLTFFSIFILYHILLPLIFKNLKSEKLSFSLKNSIYVLIIGFIQLIFYSILFYFYIYINFKLKNFTDTVMLEVYKIVLHTLLNIIFLIILLLIRYFFVFLKIFLSFENFSFSSLKNSLFLSSRNYLKLSIFHLIIFLINYLLLNLLDGNIINVIVKTYFFVLSLSYYLTLKEGK